jgi:predicted DNA-binding transcriptional regulator AlpA
LNGHSEVFVVRAALVQPTYLSTKQVCARLGGVTRQWLWLAVRHHGFPKPLKRPGGSRCFYPLDQIEAWEATAFHANDNNRAPALAPPRKINSEIPATAGKVSDQFALIESPHNVQR